MRPILTLSNEENWPAYAELLEHSPLADIAIELWGMGEVWFLYEQVFKKERGTSRRTPWHQDSPYLAIEGEQLAVLWISFEPLSEVESLELVRGSHRGPMYDGSRFDPTDDTAPIYGSLPRLPDIEADRGAWDIVSYPIEPGDIVAFHPMTLHGGAPASAQCPERRTLSLRFFGDDAVYRRRPGPCGPRVEGLHEALSDGDPFRFPSFYRLR